MTPTSMGARLDQLPPHCSIEVNIDPESDRVRFRAHRNVPCAVPEHLCTGPVEYSEWSGWFDREQPDGVRIELAWAAFTWPSDP